MLSIYINNFLISVRGALSQWSVLSWLLLSRNFHIYCCFYGANFYYSYHNL